MLYIEAPNRIAINSNTPSLFVAGAITGAPEWQTEIIKEFKDLDMIVYNPRGANFPINDPNAAYEQIKWEYDMLRKASMILFWFCKETMGPIVLYELGAWSMTNKPIVIGMDPGYSRRQDVEIQTMLVRPEIKIVYTLKTLADQVINLYNQLKMFA